MQIDAGIEKFIRAHHVLTLATIANGLPWCCSCFYAFVPEEKALIFSSDITTRHGKEALENANVAGSIVLETRIVGKIQGIQFTGVATFLEGKDAENYRKHYTSRFPYTMLMDLKMWKLELNYIKMTDNKLGFGKKKIWQRE